MAPPPPVLMDELVEEVLIRLPPHDPASLVHAALVCTAWCRLVADPGFRRRFHKFHRNPPILGILYRMKDALSSTFVRTSSFRPIPGLRRSLTVIDARHGRLLVQCSSASCLNNPNENALAVWDLITNEQRELPLIPELTDVYSWNASVLCANTNTCDHLDCNRGPFIVVLVVTRGIHICVYTYSSEAGAWSKLATGRRVPRVDDGHIDWHWQCNNALVGNTLYVKLRFSISILKLNLDTGKMSVIELPSSCHHGCIVLMTTKAGRLGFASVLDSKLCLWSFEATTGYIVWSRYRVIDLKRMVSYGDYTKSFRVVGFADGVDVIILCVNDEIFTFDLKSGHAIKLCKDDWCTFDAFPYMSLCFPALRAASLGEGPRSSAPCAQQT